MGCQVKNVSVPETSQSENNATLEKRRQSKVPKLKSPFFGFGILCCIASGLFFSFNSLVVKLITSVSAMEMAAFRCIFQFFLLLPVATYGKFKFGEDLVGPPGMFKFLVIRGFAGSTAAIFLYQAVVRLSLGDAVTISYCNVIISQFLAYLFLHESLTLIDGLLSILTITGIVLISQPAIIFGSLGSDMSTEKIIGILCGVGCAFFSATSFVVIRKLGKETPLVMGVIYYSIVGSFTSVVYLIATGEFTLPCFHELGYLFLLGILGAGGQIPLTLALRYERAGTIAVLRSFQIIMVFVLQVAILNDAPTLLSLLGAGIIFLTIFSVSIRKLYNHQKTAKAS